MRIALEGSCRKNFGNERNRFVDNVYKKIDPFLGLY